MTFHDSSDRSVEDEVGAVAAAIRIGVDRHPSARQLSAYHRAQLSPADTEALRDHLAQCPECADLVLDLDRFDELATEPGGEEWEPRKSAVWNSLRTSVGDQRPATSPLSRSSWAPLAMAALLALVTGLGSWLLQRRAVDLARTHDELADTVQRLARAEQRIAELEDVALEDPQLVVPSHDVFPPAFQRSGETRPVLVIPPEARFFVLRLHVATADDHSDYSLRILDSEGREVWSGHGLVRTPEGSFRLAVPRRLLPAGAYRLELYGAGEASARLLESYELTIEHR